MSIVEIFCADLLTECNLILMYALGNCFARKKYSKEDPEDLSSHRDTDLDDIWIVTD